MPARSWARCWPRRPPRRSARRPSRPARRPSSGRRASTSTPPRCCIPSSARRCGRPWAAARPSSPRPRSWAGPAPASTCRCTSRMPRSCAPTTMRWKSACPTRRAPTRSCSSSSSRTAAARIRASAGSPRTKRRKRTGSARAQEGWHDAAGRAARRGCAEWLRTRGQPAGEGRGPDRAAHQPPRQGVRARRAHAGLAHARPHLVRLQPPGQEAVRDGVAAVWHAGAVARSLRAGHGRRQPPSGARHPARRADHPQGLPQAHRLLLGVQRGRRHDADGAQRLSQGPRPQEGLPGGPGHRLLRGVVGARRAQGRLRGGGDRGRYARHRRRRLAGEELAGHDGRRRAAAAIVRHQSSGGLTMRHGLRIPSFALGPKTAKLDAMGEYLRRAESLGFDSAVTIDHLLLTPPAYACTWLEAMTTLAALAGVTRSIKLGTMVLVLPLRNPAYFAKEWATLDVLSNGRTILGLGVGWHEDEFALMGVPYRERGPRTSEAIEAIKALWAGDDVTFDGKYYRFQHLTIDPKPLQLPHPPIWIGGGTQPSEKVYGQTVPDITPVLKRIAKYADTWVPHSSSTPEQVKGDWERVQTFAREYGRDPARIGRVYSTFG